MESGCGRGIIFHFAVAVGNGLAQGMLGYVPLLRSPAINKSFFSSYLISFGFYYRVIHHLGLLGLS